MDCSPWESLIVDTINKTHATVLGFQETKEDFSTSYLKSLTGYRDFDWHSLPSKGCAGGILMGIDLSIFYIVSWSHLEFSISCLVKLKTTGHTFRIITVYGSPYEEGK